MGDAFLRPRGRVAITLQIEFSRTEERYADPAPVSRACRTYRLIVCTAILRIFGRRTCFGEKVNHECFDG
jgi:hypothetical protein